MNGNPSTGKSDRRPVRAAARAARPAAPATTEAQRRAAVILEVLAGVRTAPEAADALKISVNHYYLLERKALSGLVAACEPVPHRGRTPTIERRLEQLERELAASRRDCQRQAALVRAAQRAVGLPCSTAMTETTARAARSRAGKPEPRRRRTQPRALRAARALQRSLANAPPAAVEPDGETGVDRSLLGNQELSHGTPRTQTAGPGAH
jgi:hypothetical protein